MSEAANATPFEQNALVTQPRHQPWVYCLGPAVAMSLGWGLRGFIGGGPLGAMIPGAMAALLLCLILDLDKRTSAVMAAFGAIGVGFGGQMTYGQTIGFIVQPGTFFWGLMGLSVKGGIWGLIGGTFLGLGLVQRQIQRKDILIGLVLLLVGTLIGWKLINEPRLIYFSNPHDKPRAEIWAGLLVGTLFLLGYLAFKGHAKIPLHFALWGALGGAIGFGGGGLWMSFGKTLPAAKQWVSWWKLMELTFGFCFGLTLGWAAWLKRDVILSAHANPHPEMSRLSAMGLTLTAATLMSVVALWSDANVSIVWGFTFFGVALLVSAVFSEQLAWQIALTVTSCAFAVDLVESFYKERKLGDPLAGWVLVAITTLALGFLVACRERSGKPVVRWAFLTLMWLAVLVSYLKTFMHPPPFESHGLVELVFTLDAVALTWLVGNKIHRKVAGSKTTRL